MHGTTAKNGLGGAHFETMLGVGISLGDVLALASAALDVRDLDVEDEQAVSTVASAPTVRSPRGLVVPSSPIHVLVAA